MDDVAGTVPEGEPAEADLSQFAKYESTFIFVSVTLVSTLWHRCNASRRGRTARAAAVWGTAGPIASCVSGARVAKCPVRRSGRKILHPPQAHGSSDK
ncbi:hypothetical protein GCM10011614_21630 [Novosphingobium colocasiae]|uniref:Uncharacterized protein n=1 Tax=Novosphingobium colocasiae TaxID=1256513 RepID=A0A918PFW4_9SPHN|nr:hypothetical protein GCM10011614_21630 [Novosphingobium colocasiae]